MAAAHFHLARAREARMRQPRSLLSHEEMAALIASSSQANNAPPKAGLRATAARWLKRLADRIGGHNLT